MSHDLNILFTGGSGLLGRHIQLLRPKWSYPTHAEYDIVTNDPPESQWETVVHAAAVRLLASSGIGNLDSAIAANIIGTARIVRWAATRQIRLVYISSDYVFDGERGCYSPKDSICPCNAYGWSKAGGECAVRMYSRGLIVRGSFGPVPFPYPAAFSDQYTSRLPVAEFGRRLVDVAESGQATGIIHICDRRMSVLDYARSVSPGITISTLSRSDALYRTPRDTSLVE
jgi:dTDP-4-dehydrorhamnose reductase